MRIRSLGVIDDAVVELSPGFTAVTGETGAGKTMVVTSLGLLLGGRADPALVRIGAKSAVVEGRIGVGPRAPAAVRAEEAGAELDDGALLISRTLSAEGRSRAHVGGRSVPVGLLAELADDLVAVHGQTDQQGLLRPARQRQALDRYAGDTVAVPLAKYTAAHRRLRGVAAELDELTTQARERSQEADLLRFGLDEIAEAEPQPGEDTDLAAEAERLGHAEALASAASAAHAALAGNPEDPEGVDATTLVAGAHRALEAVRSHDQELSALAERLGEIGILMADVAGELASYADGLDADPLRLAAVEERRAALNHLTRKYGQDIAAVLAWSEESAARLAELDGDDDRIGELAAERDALRAELGELAQTLTDARTASAKRFADAVTAELAELAMPHARVTVEIRQTEVAEDADGIEVGGRTVAYGPAGADEVELLLAPHPGAPPRPIAKGASGGELSRVMLAVEVVFAGSDPVPTYLFDEVDAGVGGKAAVEVGRRLARLAKSAQVVVVTHLPQVAAFADRQLLVAKTDDGSVTRSGVTVLEGEERVRELSRMLAGQEDSETARAHAEELLETARTGN
ncbi:MULTISPECIES: DNA repair protein RecN [unclassified Streptomyces]|uniref:DNA repair protein RecN n=1 Tax=unclassified Streptomyces TaxID=2593676 RepID=UPI00089160B7|nr:MULTISPECIES: DNA repair protein RecN [unclassified Streptomyces]PBC81624.1 DNA replication and repair protein RecN [Streptomyces sp. 2321.6]SDR53935.1 DNA replication and repair protein RecN [Streptomyces sp. KS_16]SEC23338.1 DNA replication and repair protein RecN [Streptomyces sp. 2133.1]SNC66012.1 DNA repair protein RecN (Recombination protein N) [Streptomyces sp. 2114.4]